MYDIKDEIFTSVPCVINAKGISHAINLSLEEKEKAQLMASVDTLRKTVAELKW